MSSRVVITGAAGFIGSHLAEALLDRGHSVVGIDNLVTGDVANIAHLANRDFLFIEHDVTNYIYLDGPVDIVLHWASPASPIDYLEIPIPTLKVGALGTHKALGLAKAKNAKFVLASTSEVYGDPLEHPQTESYWGNVNPIGPRGVYDEAKRFAEAMTTAYHRYHGVDAKIVRIFNTYGPRMRVRDGRAVPNFISQALRGEDLTVYGDGSQTRSFCFISDLVNGVLRLVDSDTNDPVNLGNPQEMTIGQIANEILALTDSKSQIVYRELPVDDPRVRQPDISRARALLDWEPSVSLADGLSQVVQHGKFDLKMTVNGDDQHHLAEDVAICLGKAFSQALGEKQGIVRMADVKVPMDDALAMVVLDFSGRAYTVLDLAFNDNDMAGFATDLIRHFLESFASEAKLTLHARIIYGTNDHHRAEGLFKALGSALDGATRIDPRSAGESPSTKGLLEQ